MLRDLVLRFGLPLITAIGAVTVLTMPLVERGLTEWFRADVEQRSRLVMRSIEDSLVAHLSSPTSASLDRYLGRVTSDERLVAIVVCDRAGGLVYRTEVAPREIECRPTPAESQSFQLVQSPQGLLHLARFRLEPEAGTAASVVIAHDLGFIDRRQTRARDYIVGFAALGAGLLVVLSVLIAWFLMRSWVKRLVVDIRGRAFQREPNSGDASNKVLDQVRTVLREIEAAQRQEVDFRENWTPEALQHVVREHLEGAEMIVVSNREPYIHSREGDRVVVELPASGMVTALEPIMRACSGTWVAHGGGTADRETVDAHNRVRVPPDAPTYTLRRVWLSEEDEQGYYYGFSNEGLWPLCHLAFVRPAFRPADWERYVAVNRRFADAVAAEVRGPNPVILVQDYHFALLPQMLRERIPGATIAVFWHIPWPNAEAFGVCPWRAELLKGMLAADIVGFHTRAHCRNFLETVDRYAESHIDHEASVVAINDHECSVDAYPISIEWPPRWIDQVPSVAECRARVIAAFGLRPDVRIGLGVERWDFTKGIVDRMLALERLLDTQPRWRGQVVLLQVAAPSRSKLPAYQALQQATIETAERINAKYGFGDYRPIVLIAEHCGPARVFELFRACDFCVVNSLHDGMNLVAKEFVAARNDEEGVLVLSTFAGAARELLEAVLVNPFDVDDTAAAIGRALDMPADERRTRMRIMRSTVKENNVYRWAGRMLMDAARIRQRQRLRALEVRPTQARQASERRALSRVV